MHPSPIWDYFLTPSGAFYTEVILTPCDFSEWLSLATCLFHAENANAFKAETPGLPRYFLHVEQRQMRIITAYMARNVVCVIRAAYIWCPGVICLWNGSISPLRLPQTWQATAEHQNGQNESSQDHLYCLFIACLQWTVNALLTAQLIYLSEPMLMQRQSTVMCAWLKLGW